MSILSNNTYLVTGGAGFIGSHLVDYLINLGNQVVVVDKLSYSGNLVNLKEAQATGRLIFIEKDICDNLGMEKVLHKYNINAVFHLAAESHVDNSIKDAAPFIQTNIVGTYSMLTASLRYWEDKGKNPDFRFVHVSTDEVFGHLMDDEPPFTENSAYAPNSPYAASKAASDHLARAWYVTYGLPVIITNCSNNFGSRQHYEKLIPTIIRNALQNQSIPIYGTGKNIRDWLFVKDHCQGLYLAATKGKVGETYCFGGTNEKRNIDIAMEICQILDEVNPRKDGKSFRSQITYVENRKGHDWRYAIDFSKAKNELGFQPSEQKAELLRSVVLDYIKCMNEELIINEESLWINC